MITTLWKSVKKTKYSRVKCEATSLTAKAF